MDISKPISLSSPEFIADKWAIFERLREEQPISKIKVSVLTLYGISRFDDCDMLLNDPRLVRNRTTATGGGSRLPFPIPKSVSVLMESMIQEDDPNHRRLRELVRKAFQPQAIKTLEERIEGYSDELLGGLNKNSGFELQNDYARHIPERMIADMVGIGHDQMPQFRSLMGSLSEGFSGLRILRTFILDMPKHLRFVREIVREKKTNPGEDILTHLIFAEEDGDRLSEDEVVAKCHWCERRAVKKAAPSQQLFAVRATPGAAGSLPVDEVRLAVLAQMGRRPSQGSDACARRLYTVDLGDRTQRRT